MSESPAIRIRRVSAAEVYPLRHKVLRPNRAFEDCIFLLDDDPATAHFAAEYNGKIIGIASIAINPREGDPPDTWRLRGMATEPEWQGKGIGAQVLAACLEHARAQGSRLMWCNARTSALEFYGKYGFETVGEEFDIKGIGPHFVMIRRL